MSFWENLQIGNKAEEAAAEYFRQMGYSVWVIGAFRLCADLYVWKGRERFWVQVKYRNPDLSPPVLRNKEIEQITKAIKDTRLPFLLVIYWRWKRQILRLRVRKGELCYGSCRIPTVHKEKGKEALSSVSWSYLTKPNCNQDS